MTEKLRPGEIIVAYSYSPTMGGIAYASGRNGRSENIRQVNRANQNYYKKRKEEMIKIDNRCFYCRKELTIQTATIDHINPLHYTGKDVHSNQALCCHDCNSKKGHRIYDLQSK